MKRKLQCLFLAVICGVVLFLVIWLDKSGKRPDNYKHPATPQAVSSEGISVQSKENVKQERIKNAAKITVKDGKKDRTLYWEEVDLNNVGVCADYLSSGIPFASNYSQISEGHYYYLRHELGKQYTYIIYQDEGKIIGKFNVEGDMEVFLKYQNDYFVSYYDGENQFSRINTEKEIDAISSEYSWYCGEVPFMIGSPLWLYDNYIYYYPGYSIDKETGIKYMNEEEDITGMVKAPLDNLKDMTEVKIPDRILQNYPYLVFVDGKMIYGEEDRGEISLYSYDMETDTELKIFSFQQKKRRIKDTVKIQFDKDFLYCGEYLIPLSGGKMQIIDNKNKKTNYSYNEKYIYYIDDKFNVHRIDKKTMENNIISQVKAMKVDVTDQSVYVQGYNRELFESSVIPYEELEDQEWEYVDWDWYSCALYKMDIDGEHLHKIADEMF